MSAVMHPDLSRLSRSALFLHAGMAVFLAIMYWDGLSYLVGQWSAQDEYSHGFLIPLVALYLLWQNMAALQRLECRGSWWGAVLVVLSLALFLLGELSTLYILIQYSFLILLAGLVLSFAGFPGLRVTWVPLVVLLIRSCGVSVFLEGNVIDLGAMKLEVAEACSGLRYLFPLLTVSFILAYVFRAPLWMRLLVFVSALPITVLMNSFRIGIIGLLVDRWGPAMAEGFLHDFEGWVVFMLSLVVLLAEILLLARLSGDRRPLMQMIGLHGPAPTPRDAPVRYRRAPMPCLAVAALLTITTIVTAALPARAEIVPARSAVALFPSELGGWQGRMQRLEQIYIDALKFDDYLLGNYANRNGRTVNLYAAYYDSQRKGESVHSPRSCIPGGGWEIVDIVTWPVNGVQVGGKTLQVNRVLIQKGETRQLVYYWFQQRGRVITNEYLVKWYLFWDALTRNRSDGSLIRLTTMLAPGEELAAGDGRLADFADVAVPRLHSFIPD